MTIALPRGADSNGTRIFPRLALLLAGFLFAAADSAAQVQSVTVNKSYHNIQTSAANVGVNPNYSFNADVDGNNIGSITPPTISGPFTAALGTMHNNGVLLYSTGDHGWRYGFPNANDWGGSSLSVMNSLFGSGTYTFTVNGATIPLQLTGDAYPNTPLLTLSGGVWSNGKYVIDPRQPLTITTNAYTAYGSHADDMIGIVIGSGNLVVPFADVAPYGCAWFPLGACQRHSTQPGTNTLTYTVPANTLVAGLDYIVVGRFEASVDLHPDPALPGSVNVAYYAVTTNLTLSAVTPVFPMTVSGSVTSAVANITANIQYRPADIGTSGSVYSFALAPAGIVKNAVVATKHLGPMTNATATAAPLACVLAQLDASGQLKAVTSNNLVAYLTGVFGSSGAAVDVLKGVPTTNVAGAAFYIGYGASASGMIKGGVNRQVVTVPGAQVCEPQAPQTGWWWNPAESGRGFAIETRGSNLFMAGYLYDVSGRATWTLAFGATSLDGSIFDNNLNNFSGGQTLTGNYQAPAGPVAGAGITLTFSDARHGTMIWPGGTVAIERADNVIPPGTTPSFVPENGWWWNAAESGRGYFMEFKNNFLDIAGYMYDASGNPLWYLSLGNMAAPTSYSGSWTQYANGQTLTGAYKPPGAPVPVGLITIEFQDATHATMTSSGKQVPLTRFAF